MPCEWQVMLRGSLFQQTSTCSSRQDFMPDTPGTHGTTLQASPFSFMTVYLLHCSNPRMTVPLLTDSTLSRQATYNQYTCARRNPYTSSTQQLTPPFDVSCDDERRMIDDAGNLRENMDTWYVSSLLADR